MFYSILPPIIVVLSLVGIIIFLVKKSSKIKKVYQDDAAELMRSKNLGNGVHSETASSERGNHKWKKAESIFLIILEKTTRRMRTFSLKLEVWFSGLSGKIRNRRNQMNPQNGENNPESKQEEKILEKVIDYKSRGVFEKKPMAEDSFKLPTQEEKVAEPMISKNVTLPKVVPGMKNKLEELLIERVAANPKDIEAYERLGEYYMEIENYTDAKECFKQVMRLNPTNRNVRYKIKRLERLLGE